MPLAMFNFSLFSAHNSGSKCCYDQRGNLMYAGDVTAGEMAIGSISQRAHVAGSPPYDTVGMVPMLSHVKIDLIPFFHCCLMGDNCMKYLHRRPTADCVNYKSPKSGKSLIRPLTFIWNALKPVR